MARRVKSEEIRQTLKKIKTYTDMSDNYHPPRSLTDFLEEEEEAKRKNDFTQQT